MSSELIGNLSRLEKQLSSELVFSEEIPELLSDTKGTLVYMAKMLC